MVDIIHREFVKDRFGRLRQAGTVDPNDAYIQRLREICESNLFAFAYLVLGRTYLTRDLHLPICAWLQRTPPYRKMLLLPRRHAKTSIVSHALPLHILIQPPGGHYIPEKAGNNCRIMLAGETEDRATGNLSVIRNVLEKNELFRGFWPHLVWDQPRREASQWHQKALVIPRDENYPDPSIRAIGVGGAIVGARHDVHIKDDLVGEEAANSEVVMTSTINWHVNSRALFDDPDRSIEYIIGTRWAVNDLYSYITTEDPTVAYIVRSIVEDGATIYPEVFTLETVERLENEFGLMFPLLYMNNIGDPKLIDFQEAMLRFYEPDGDYLMYEREPRDDLIEERFGAGISPQVSIKRGEPLDWGKLAARAEYLTAKGR